MNIDLENLTTESRNSRSFTLDNMSSLQILETMNQEDATVSKAVQAVLPQAARVVEHCIAAFRAGGRLIYMGAGTSGRLGMLDAAECPPTFGVPDTMVLALLAGGDKAFKKAIEGAEDSYTLGKDDLENLHLRKKDVVVGIAASGRTPYVVGGLRYAQETGCFTAAIVCNHNTPMDEFASEVLPLIVGAEVLSGSTRLKAATAQKMMLNMISTASMVGIGKAYQNLMVDVMQTNEKLKVRAQNIVMSATECSREKAKEVLDKAEGSAKLAIVMLLLSCSAQEAKEKLKEANGHVRSTLPPNFAGIT